MRDGFSRERERERLENVGESGWKKGRKGGGVIREEERDKDSGWREQDLCFTLNSE